jgi:hypothetical protein
MKRRTKMTRMKRSLARVSSIWKNWMNPPKTDGSAAEVACPCCGARGYTYIPRTTAEDVAVTVLCSILLLAIAVPAAWATEQWMEREGQNLVNHMMVWREPVENW